MTARYLTLVKNWASVQIQMKKDFLAKILNRSQELEGSRKRIMVALHTLIVYITITLYCSDNCKVNYGNIVFLGDSIGSTKIVMGLPKSQYTKNQFSLHHH